VTIPPPDRLVILAPNWLGDAVMALPLFADIGNAWPDTEIVVAARQSVAPLFAMVPRVSRTLTLQSGGGLRLLQAMKQNAATLAEGGFDAALLLPNSFQSAWIASHAGIPERWGYPRDLRARLLTRAIERPASDAHQAEYYQALARGLGIPSGERYARLHVSDADRARARALVDEAGIGSRFVVAAPGAAYGRAKQWLPERFAELARLAGERGIATVVIGAKNDAASCREVAALAPDHVADLTGRTDLATAAALMAIAEAVVANDSGAMHVAGAVGARLAAVFGPTDDSRTSPLAAGPDAPRPVVLKADVWCRPCMLRECPIDHRCMRGVSAQAVFDALGLA